MTTRRRSGRRGSLQPAQQGEREVALEVALVELIEHHGAGALQTRIGRKRRVSTPSVRKRRRVRGPATSSKRT